MSALILKAKRVSVGSSSAWMDSLWSVEFGRRGLDIFQNEKWTEYLPSVTTLNGLGKERSRASLALTRSNFECAMTKRVVVQARDVGGEL